MFFDDDEKKEKEEELERLKEKMRSEMGDRLGKFKPSEDMSSRDDNDDDMEDDEDEEGDMSDEDKERIRELYHKFCA